MTARIVAVCSGLWLMFAPSVLAHGDPAASNDRIFGPIGAAVAFVAIWEVTRPLRWATLPVGVWLVFAPFLLGYADMAATVSSVVAGAIMAVTAPLSGGTKQTYGGGWKTLLPGGRVPEGGIDSNG